jgi:tetratricopeptide (TPR) repeat protein
MFWRKPLVVQSLNGKRTLPTLGKRILSGAFLLCLATVSSVAIARASTDADDRTAIAATVADASLAGSLLAAQIAARANDDEAAVAFYQRSLALDPNDAAIRELLFLALTANGRIAEAIQTGTDLPEGGNARDVARLVNAIDAAKRKSWDRVGELLQGRRTGELDRLVEETIKAWATLATGDSAKALETLKALQGADWIALIRDYQIGLLQMQAGNGAEGIASFEAATKNEVAAAVLTETYMRAIEAQVRLQYAQGDVEGAKKTLARGLNLVPNNPPLRQLERIMGEGKPMPALVTSPQQGIAEILYNIGTALSRQGGTPFAQSYLQLAKYINPTSDATLMALAAVYESNKFHERANGEYAGIAPESAYYRRARLEKALNLNEMKRIEEAKVELRALVDSDPDDITAYLTLGSVLAQHEEYKEAAAIYDAAVARLPNPESHNWNLFYRRGIAYERLKEWDKAEQNFRKSLELSPRQADVLNYLGYSWIDMGIHLDEGMDMIKKAVDLKPRSGFIVDSLGWAYFRLGKYEDAVRELERAVELMPSDPVVNDHLGDAYWKVGRKLEAVFQWNHALASEPEAADEAKIREKLKVGLVDEAKAPALQ